MDHGWLKAILDSAPEGVLVEWNERIIYVNQRYAELLGYRSPSELNGRFVAEVVGPSDVQRLTKFGRERREGRTAPISYDFIARRRDGEVIRLSARVTVARIEFQQCIATFVVPFYAESSAEETPQVDGPHTGLSPRERQVMDALMAGRRIKEIAVDFSLSEKTVATHRARMLRKLGLSDNRELYQYALRHRLIHWA
jgi:PAS domain S-box-containing protein